VNRRLVRVAIVAGAAIVIAAMVLFSFRRRYVNMGRGPGEQPSLNALDHPLEVHLMRLGSPLPEGMGDAIPMPKGTAAVHNYFVNGAKRATDMQLVTRAVKDGFVDGDKVGTCFEPHHMVRVVTPNLKFDFLVSYKCEQTRVFVGDELVATFPTKDNQAELEGAFHRSGL
jgi:hypothetical protein